MKPKTLLATLALSLATMSVQAQTLLQAIVTPEKAVAVVNQTLEGTWLAEVRPGNLPAAAPAVLQLVTYNANGTFAASPSDGTQSLGQGVWVRVGDRKYLLTVFAFSYNEARVLTTIAKARVNIQVSLDGQTIKGTNEAVIMDRTGKVLATVPGGTVSAVRLSPEITGDFYDFQKVQ
jgi:hypothetical protein